MPYWIITFFIGVSALSFCQTLPSIYWLLLPIFLFLSWVLMLWQGKILSRKWIMQLLIFTLGFSWMLIYTHWIAAWSLSPDLEGKKILITGYVDSLPRHTAHGVSFVLKTQKLAEQKITTKLKLSWYGDFRKLQVGDKWRLLVRLKRPHGVLNPGGFDLEKHLLIHHIRATGYVVNSESNQVLASSNYSYPLSRMRQFLISKMEQSLIGEDLAPLIIAFVTGAEDKITQPQWQVMRDTGTSYLVAIAGLHIGLVAGIAFILVQFLWCLSRRLPLLLPAKEAGISVGLLMGFIYGAVSGFSIPTQRSLVMLVIFSMAIIFRRHSQSWNAWLWSLFLVLIINPLAALTIGFWLSFSAVAAIIYATSCRIKQKTTHLAKFWRMQFTVTLALLPLTLLFFQQFSVVTMIANLIAMPLVCMVVVPMSLVGTLCLLIPGNSGFWILWCGAKILHLVWWWLTFLAHSFNCSWYQPIYNWWILMFSSIGVLILLAPRGFPAKSLGLLWLLPLFFYNPPGPDINNEVWFTLLDVGQGLAAVVQTKNHILLYDTGPKYFENDAGTSVIIPYLRQVGIKNIDTLVVSHGDSDHSGGVLSILKSVPVTNILTSVPEKFAPYSSQFCFAGQHWEWDGVDFQIISPPIDGLLLGNDASCVLKITTGKNSILLPGDIERVAEDLLVENHNVDLKSTVLVAPHHGSATSSTMALVKLVTPKYVIFPVGYKNRFRFPHKKILTRYMESNAILLNASKTGAIVFKFGDKSDILDVSYYREKIRRFWHD